MRIFRIVSPKLLVASVATAALCVAIACRRHAGTVALTLTLAGTVVLVSTMAAQRAVQRAAETRTTDDLARVPVRRCAVVLGCTPVLRDGRPNLYFRYRIEAAAQLYRAGKVTRLIVSGDNHREDYDEPSAMKAALVAAGIPAEHVQPDYAGFRTLDSVVRAREVFGQESVIMVSQAFHNRRAVYLGLHRGVDVFGYNARDVVAPAGRKTRLREAFACVRAVADVRLLGTQPRFLGPRVPVE